MSNIRCFDSKGLWMFRCDCGKETLLKVDYKKKTIDVVEG